MSLNSPTLARPVGALKQRPNTVERPKNQPTHAGKPQGRKLGPGHFAFMRAVVQGVDLRASWERYLQVEGDVEDLRLVRSTIAWIREEFAAAARRQDRFGTARLVRLDVQALGAPKQVLPSLEEFAESVGLEDESQAEQIRAYEEAFGRESARQRRRGRLIAQQLEALRWLESQLAQPPRAGDAVAAWLHPALASKLEAADIFTIAQLSTRINGIGQRWFAGIKALGEGKAERIVDWLRENADTIEIPLGDHVRRPRGKLFTHELAAVVQPAFDIRPLEKLLVPIALDGSAGLYRRPQSQCLLKATNDHQAILAWIRSKHGLTPEQKLKAKARRRERDAGIERPDDWLQALSHTQRAYRKEAERFLLWAIVQKGKALSSMTNEDCAEYRDFLGNPTPTSRWCGERNRQRWSPLWRPFEGPLSPSAQGQAITILKNLYRFLVDQNYLMGNPWSSVTTPRGSAPRMNAGRSFSKAQWGFILNQLDKLPERSTSLRLRFVLKLLFATGLRLSEVTAATVDDLQWVEYPADAEDAEPVQGWLLRVVGKGQKEREVPVPIDVVTELEAYLASRHLAPRVNDIGNQGAFLLGKASDWAEQAPGLRQDATEPREGIADTTLYDQLKRFFGECAGALKVLKDHKGAERFEKASTHWMRHTHASHSIANGMPVQIAQENLGHASLATTTVYVTTEKKRRMKAVSGFWGAAGKGR